MNNIETIRRFNRMVVTATGALDLHYLGGSRSFTASRHGHLNTDRTYTKFRSICGKPYGAYGKSAPEEREGGISSGRGSKNTL